MEIELTTNRMTDIIKILQREQEESNRIYLYEENGCWYAYERSAFYLSQMLKGIALERFIVQKDTIWLVRAQISSSARATDKLLGRRMYIELRTADQPFL